ncbi:MAG: SSU ribosomal protein S8 RpsH [Oceanicaulis sp. HLUCCA04]|nr:MAG: SSU ribosomal protein S8 RpsH [Oceanicaulis sp. HLUCCA04]
MAMTDPLGDMLTRIRNALMRRRTNVVTPASKLRQRVLDVLLEEGFIRGYSESLDADGFKQFEIELKYYEGAPVISDIKRVSKPGRREYSKARDLPLVQNGLGIAIVSTPRGVMSDSAARAQNVGGEILCHVS